MNWFPFLTLLHFGAFVIYVLLGTLLLYYNCKTNVNRIASYLFFCFALWSFVKIFTHNIHTPESIVLFLENVLSISWIIAPALAFYFFAALTKREKILQNKILYIILIFFYSTIYLQVLNNNFFLNWELKEYGWFRLLKNNIWVYVYYLYIIVFVSAGLFFLLKDYLKTKIKIKKRIYGIFIITSIGTFFLILIIEILEIIFAYFNLKKSFLEDIPDLYLILFALSFFYLISKYKFLKISPVYAAETIVSSINEYLIITNDEIDIAYMNENAKITFSNNSNIYTGKPITVLFKNKSDMNKLLKELLKNDFIKNFETELVTYDNKIIPVLISASVIKQIGEMIGIVFVISDITKFKESQKILKESYEKLIEADKLKTNFLSMVSHELRTPLTTIIGFLTLMLGGATGKIPEHIKEYLEIMHKNSQRLLSLINDLLDLSKMEAGTFTISKIKTDIIHLIEETIKNLKPVYSKKNIFISFDTTIKSLKINIDPVRISQVTSNLINNAIKFSRQNSRISILLYTKVAENITTPADINLPDKNKNYTVIKIIDEGIGMNPEVLNKIFNKFYQAEDINTRKAQGAGLGLYISKEIINKHDGFIWAESEGINKGSTFTVLLPVE